MTSEGSPNRRARPVSTTIPLRPRWDEEKRELIWEGKIVKRLYREAEVQDRILVAFERAGWPRMIEDPLPAGTSENPAQRLRDAVKNLNRGLTAGTIRFHTNGRGSGLVWTIDRECGERMSE